LTSITNIRERIFSIKDEITFNEVALDIFQYQYTNNPVYHQYIQLLKTNLDSINHYSQIPFLPIEFFKSQKILTTDKPETDIALIFESSGTTGENTSRHYVLDPSLYIESFTKGFEYFYGAIKDYHILALLPSYLERGSSSLVYMVNELMKISAKDKNQFYLYEHETLYNTLLELEANKEKTLLIGVSYALLDFVEKYQPTLKNTIVMETGGMKGKRKEIIREELHETLCKGFGVSNIHSEYGMTELLSQAYSLGNGIFECPSWMQILIRDTEDALTYVDYGKTGGVNVIDLANINSCSFIATQDLGKKQPNNSFEILGRFDNSDIRGCNLMVI
jgi:phenylacetate-coenzyme A ligase PaaK-like adenylate-forming protein